MKKAGIILPAFLLLDHLVIPVVLCFAISEAMSVIVIVYRNLGKLCIYLLIDLLRITYGTLNIFSKHCFGKSDYKQ